MRVVAAEEPPPPLRRRGSFAAEPVADPSGEPTSPFVRVYVAASVHRELAATRAFSLDAEEGGFLFGRVYRDEEPAGDSSTSYLIEVTHAIPAEHTDASRAEVTFTGASFAAMRRRLDAVNAGGGGVRLAGWYHTHLFGASSDLGLSEIDLELHFTTFRIPWQLAGLVNLDVARDPEGRALRFYARHDRTMVRCPEEVLR